MNHTLKNLYSELGIEAPEGLSHTELSGLTADSREVVPGGVFVAVQGVSVDGHDFIPAAIAKGAAAVVCSHITPELHAAGIHCVCVPDSAQALGQLASWWYGHPSHKLTLVGVTGTNGKTTIATLLYDMATMMGEKAGLLSTVVNRVGSQKIEATHTTPDPISIAKMMSRMVQEGCTFCAMEVSSHAAQQKRIAGLTFAGGIFTNLTRDHLDYHKTFECYLKAKKSFFDSLPKQAFALTNADDKNGPVMLQNCSARHYSYSIQSVADFSGKVIEDTPAGMELLIDGKNVSTHFMGRFNASNLMAVYGAARLIGWDQEEVMVALSRLRPVDGRMYTIHCPGDVTAIVDYAHTPDALKNVLDTIHEVDPNAHIITVTGAGGNRDKGKRPLMADVAARNSSLLIITSDNPRREAPEDIAADMLAGVKPEFAPRVTVILDRAQAIAHALKLAQKGDVVLIAGKGHETYQIIGDTKHHFDDKEEVAKAANLPYKTID